MSGGSAGGEGDREEGGVKEVVQEE